MRFLGLRTASYAVPDLATAKQWYTEVLGFAPYFDEPLYVGSNVGGYELGLVPDAAVGEGVTVYWGVEDIEAEFKRLLELGARPHKTIEDVGGGIKVAVAPDPSGTPFGTIFNPSFELP